MQRKWVLLKRMPDGAPRKFTQKGPFTTEEIQSQLRLGESTYSDYLWQQGYASWVRIGSLPDFDRTPTFDEETKDIPLPETTLPAPETAAAEEVVEKEIEYLKRPIFQQQTITQRHLPLVEEISQQDAGIEPKQALSGTTIYQKAQSLAQATDKPAASAKSRRGTHQPIVAASALAGLLVGLMLAFYFWRHAGPQQAEIQKKPQMESAAPDLQPSPQPPSQQPEVSSPQSEPAEPKAEPPSSQSKVQAAPSNAFLNPRDGSASVLQIVPKALDGLQAVLYFKTDARIGSVLSVTIVGRSGEILQWPSYRKTFMVKRNSTAPPSLAIGSLHLPDGHYSIRVAAAKIQCGMSLFLGNEKNFAEQVQQTRKNLSLQQQVERKALFYGSKKLMVLQDSLAKHFSKQETYNEWRKFRAEWRQEFAIEKSKYSTSLAEYRDRMAYPDEARDFSQAVALLASQEAAFDLQFTQKRKPSSQNLKTRQAELKTLLMRLKNEAVALGSQTI